MLVCVNHTLYQCNKITIPWLPNSRIKLSPYSCFWNSGLLNLLWALPVIRLPSGQKNECIKSVFYSLRPQVLVEFLMPFHQSTCSVVIYHFKDSVFMFAWNFFFFTSFLCIYLWLCVVVLLYIVSLYENAQYNVDVTVVIYTFFFSTGTVNITFFFHSRIHSSLI